MKRRAFLRMLGVAPVVAAVPAVAVTKPDNPKRLAAGGSAVSSRSVMVGECPFVFERGEFMVNATSLRSRNGKLVIDFGGGACEVRIKG